MKWYVFKSSQDGWIASSDSAYDAQMRYFATWSEAFEYAFDMSVPVLEPTA
jgi:hypothetical protein